VPADREIGGHQCDRRVALAKGGQPLQFFYQAFRYVCQRDRRVDCQGGRGTRRGLFLKRAGELAAELIDLVSRKAQPGSTGMPAIGEQQIGLGGDSRADVIAGGATRRAAGDLVARLRRQKDAGPPVTLGQISGDDS